MKLLILLGVIVGFTVFLVIILHDPEAPEPDMMLAEPEPEPAAQVEAAPLVALMTPQPAKAEPVFFEQVGARVLPQPHSMDVVRPASGGIQNPHVIDLRNRD